MTRVHSGLHTTTSPAPGPRACSRAARHHIRRSVWDNLQYNGRPRLMIDSNTISRSSPSPPTPLSRNYDGKSIGSSYLRQRRRHHHQQQHHRQGYGVTLYNTTTSAIDAGQHQRHQQRHGVYSPTSSASTPSAPPCWAALRTTDRHPPRRPRRRGRGNQPGSSCAAIMHTAFGTPPDQEQHRHHRRDQRNRRPGPAASANIHDNSNSIRQHRRRHRRVTAAPHHPNDHIYNAAGIRLTTGGTASVSNNASTARSDNLTDIRLDSTAGGTSHGNYARRGTYFIDNQSTQAFNLTTNTSTLDESDNFASRTSSFTPIPPSAVDPRGGEQHLRHAPGPAANRLVSERRHRRQRGRHVNANRRIRRERDGREGDSLVEPKPARRCPATDVRGDDVFPRGRNRSPDLQCHHGRKFGRWVRVQWWTSSSIRPVERASTPSLDSAATSAIGLGDLPQSRRSGHHHRTTRLQHRRQRQASS